MVGFSNIVKFYQLVLYVGLLAKEKASTMQVQ